MKKKKLKVKVFTIQFNFEVVNSNEPTIAIQTILVFYLTDGRAITHTEDYCRFCNEYIWVGDISKEEKHKLNILLDSDLVVDRVNELKHKFLMDKINGIESELHIYKENDL